MPEYERHLPHLQPEGVSLFLTWRLYGSIPVSRRPLLKSDPRPGFRFVQEDWELDRQLGGVCYLGDSRVAGYVAYVLGAGALERGFYDLHSWVIMPNHVHILITPKMDVSKIMRWVKASTAREANKILGLTGKKFWQDESFDRWVRNDGEFRKISRYIEWNPVSAGFVATPEEWPWSSATKG